MTLLARRFPILVGDLPGKGLLYPERRSIAGLLDNCGYSASILT